MGSVRIDPFFFLARYWKRRLNQAQSIIVLVWFIHSVIVYSGYFLFIVSLSWYVFCLLVVLVKLSSDLTRKTPLRKPNLAEAIISMNCSFAPEKSHFTTCMPEPSNRNRTWFLLNRPIFPKINSS